jgi:hypothetical protein
MFDRPGPTLIRVIGTMLVCRSFMPFPRRLLCIEDAEGGDYARQAGEHDFPPIDHSNS